MRYLMISCVCILASAACEGELPGGPTAPTNSSTAIGTRAQQHDTTPIEVTFTKWITTFPDMTGFTGGDVAGTYAGEVLRITPFDNDKIVELEARYEVTDSSGLRSFTALIAGKQNNQTGTAVLNGVVTEGWRVGAQAHVTFQVITPCEFGTSNVCFKGTIRVSGSGK